MRPGVWATRCASEKLFSRPYWVWKNSWSRDSRSTGSTSMFWLTTLLVSRSISMVVLAV